jgi:putative DNA primase/helicase
VAAVGAPKAEEPGREAQRAPETRAAQTQPAEGSDEKKAPSGEAPPGRHRHVPEHIRQRFVQVGRHYHFPDGTRAFTDRGGRLTTPSENTEVIRSLVTIAEARGWHEITVRGTERFRREAWHAARLAGLEVRGYRPTEFEQSRVARILARGRETPEPSTPNREPPIPARREGHEGVGGLAARMEGVSRRAQRRDELLTGTLIDHGRASYRHDPREPMSYFVTIETARGDRTVWGVDLERALRESLTQPAVGEEVRLRAVQEDAVTVRKLKRDAEGKVIAEKDLAVHRNRWIVEKRAFFEARAEAARTLQDRTIDPKEAVKRHPELVGTYLQVRAAELAARRFRDPEDRERFVSQVRSALADGVARGEPLPPVRLRERTAERASARSRPVRTREDAQVRG